MSISDEEKKKLDSIMEEDKKNILDGRENESQSTRLVLLQMWSFQWRSKRSIE